MPTSKVKLNNAIKILEDEISSLEEELSYLRAAKKNIETLVDRLGSNGVPVKKESELEVIQTN